uniref:Uncharacterized protein n=1 Tax=Arundo donax TaxID=35708 RepID=A0A0A9U7S6_ARUDO
MNTRKVTLFSFQQTLHCWRCFTVFSLRTTMVLSLPSLALFTIFLGFCIQRASQLLSVFSHDSWYGFLLFCKNRVYQVMLQLFKFPWFVCIGYNYHCLQNKKGNWNLEWQSSLICDPPKVN